jgi:glycosyltransferase involved in cell wall biosynthesis
MKVAINYISLGVHHVARLKSISDVLLKLGIETICLEMFSKDSDYEWSKISTDDCTFKRVTVFEGESDVVRKSPGLKARIHSCMNEIRPDVLVISGWSFPEALALLDWANKRDVPAILLSDSQERDMRRVFYKEWLKKRRVRRFDAAYVAGKPQLEYAEKLGMPRNRIWTGSCVVDNEYWTRRRAEVIARPEHFRKELALPQGYFLTVARFIEKKNMPTLLRAYAVYRELAANPLPLVMCGDGPERATIEKIVRDEMIEDVHFPGFQQADTLPVYYSLASCFILPSSHGEQWGLVVNEAMASALPVIVSEICGCASDLVKNGVNGYTFDPLSPHELAAKMLSVTCDEERRKLMGAASQRIIGGFSCEQAANNMLDCLQAVMKNRKGDVSQSAGHLSNVYE